MRTKLLLAVAFIGFTVMGITNVTQARQKIQLKEIQLQSTSAELKKLNLDFQGLNTKLETEAQQKTQNEERVKQLETEKQQLEQHKRDLETQLQARKAEKARLASIQTTQKVSAAPSPPKATGGSGCDWLRGRLAANGVSLEDIPAAINIATRESGCRSSAVNSTSGACNVFQEYTCGKWGGLVNTDAHIRGADNYAKVRYNGWYGAYQFWLKNHWW